MAAQLAEQFETTTRTGMSEIAQTDPGSQDSSPYGSFAATMQDLMATSQPADTLANPQLAQAWADAIFTYWQFGIDQGKIDAGKPFYVVDLAPDQGQLAWLLLGALRAKLASRQVEWPVCLLACCASEHAADALLKHPYLADHVEHGWLDAVLFEGDKADADLHGYASSSLHLQRQGINLLRTDNPLVILGLGYFQSLPSELLAANYGKLLQGSVAQLQQGDAPSMIELDYRWSPAETKMAPAKLLGCVSDYYLAHFPNAAFSLPVMAAEVLQRLQHMATGRYLLLAADPGVCDEQAIRLGALTPPGQWDRENARNNTRPAVNFHALGLMQHQAGAWVWQHQIDDGGIVLHAAWRDDQGELNEDCFDCITAQLDRAHPSQSAAMRELITASNVDGATPLAAASLLAMLRQSQHDPVLLKLALLNLSRQPPVLSDCARREWHKALTHTWSNFMPLQQSDGFYYDIALFAMQTSYWGLAQDCLHQGLGWYGDDAHELYLLAWCEAATGASASALTRLERALTLAPDHAPACELHTQLTEKMSRWQNLAWYQPHLATDAELSIEPLGQEHAASLLYPYRDEQIGIMTRLPALRSVEEAQAWITEEAQDTGRRSYAVMHACWGLIGVVSSHCAHEAGYFYFWIGSDFQQRGFGQRAAKLLFTQLTASGVSGVYTSVYKENLHSQYLMKKLGLVRMEINTLPPDDAQYFYYLGGELNEEKVLKDFLGLCDGIECPIQVKS
jgi:RimJ/RimL family protein N-acetyltransferase